MDACEGVSGDDDGSAARQWGRGVRHGHTIGTNRRSGQTVTLGLEARGMAR